jgi:hypothetical protein
MHIPHLIHNLAGTAGSGCQLVGYRSAAYQPRSFPMRVVSYSLAAAGISSLLLSAVIVHAVLAPVSHQVKPEVSIASWSTTVTRD